jgi:hypothetical protein
MNFMLNLAYEKSTWYQSIGLEEPIAQASFTRKRKNVTIVVQEN